MVRLSLLPLEMPARISQPRGHNRQKIILKIMEYNFRPILISLWHGDASCDYVSRVMLIALLKVSHVFACEDA